MASNTNSKIFWSNYINTLWTYTNIKQTSFTTEVFLFYKTTWCTQLAPILIIKSQFLNRNEFSFSHAAPHLKSMNRGQIDNWDSGQQNCRYRNLSINHNTQTQSSSCSRTARPKVYRSRIWCAASSCSCRQVASNKSEVNHFYLEPWLSNRRDRTFECRWLRVNVFGFCQWRRWRRRTRQCVARTGRFSKILFLFLALHRQLSHGH